VIDRRNFLRLGLGTALGAAIGVPLASARSRRRPTNKKSKAKACILLYMVGGPSQIDTFDPKPGIPGAAGIKAINTSVSGVQYSELLPLLARQARHLAVVRSISSKEGNHARARHLMHTGYVPAGGVDHPAFGSIVSSERGHGPLPGYVSIGGPGAGAGFLGAGHAPFAVFNPKRPVRNLSRHQGLTQRRFDERVKLGRQLDTAFAKAHSHSQFLRDRRAVSERALAMMKSAKSAAFDLSKEPAKSKLAYGASAFGQGCLMARRLVAAGVPFVEVMQRGWDTHQNNTARVKKLTADLDRGMSALIADLEQRGMLDSTLIVWAGDFGRTPWLNGAGGRDHYPAVTPAALAGGGVRGGRIIGVTDKQGRKVIKGKAAPADLFATIADALGLDPDKERKSPAGRPIATVDGGTAIPGVLS
jgi:uncharacterized protein (DUF1501 family)